MVNEPFVQTGLPGTSSVFDRLKSLADSTRCVRLEAASAYLTVAGVRAMLDLVPSDAIRASRWVVGLDDAVTQPGAIRLLQSVAGIQVRVASLAFKARRFHPKLVLLNGGGGDASVLMIGSANLTAFGLKGNAEAVTFMKSQSNREKTALQQPFAEIWGLGHFPTAAEIEVYEKRYAVRKKFEAKIGGKVTTKSKAMDITQSDYAEIDPSVATICWIECGSNTAQGRELEIKAEQGLFFGLSASGGPPAMRRFRVSDGSVVPLRFVYQGNHMWRLQLNKDVPEVMSGLRPRQSNGSLGRSPYVAVFEKTAIKEEYILKFLFLNSKAFDRLKTKTVTSGTFGRTTARQYGWTD